MRTIQVLDSLFPAVRQGILGATLTRPHKWWYQAELAGFLHTRPSSLQRELDALVGSGILEQRRDGRRVYFRAETRAPVFHELRSILEKTAGLVPTLQTMLRPLAGKISIAIVYGSVARKQERADSDVDLMVIGNVGLAELSPSLRKAEEKLGREINVTNYTLGEFRRNYERNNHFVATILKNGIQFVIGGLDDLEAITRLERRQAAQNVERITGKRARNHRSRSGRRLRDRTVGGPALRHRL